MYYVDTIKNPLKLAYLPPLISLIVQVGTLHLLVMERGEEKAKY